MLPNHAGHTIVHNDCAMIHTGNAMLHNDREMLHNDCVMLHTHDGFAMFQHCR